MNPVVVIWILAIIISILIGRDVAKWALAKDTKLVEKKRAALVLAAELRKAGLVKIPLWLEDYALTNWQDAIVRIHDFAQLVVLAGNDAIIKELEGVYASVLAAKLATPEGRAYLKVQVAEAEKPAA